MDLEKRPRNLELETECNGCCFSLSRSLTSYRFIESRVESIRIARTQVVIVGKIWWYRLSSKNVSIMFRYYFFFDALRYVHERTLTYKDFPNINSITFGSHNGILQAKKFPFLSQVVPFIFKFRHFLSFPYHINFSIT